MSSFIRLVGAIAVSVIVTVSFGVVLWLYLTRKVAGETPGEMLSLMVGALTSNFTAVVQYWIGSSSGSHLKDDEIARKDDELLRRGV